LLRVEAKSILNKHRRRDPWFLDDYSVNPYYGCPFGCVYCYVRGGRYGSSVRGIGAKVNAPEVLERQLRRRARRGEYGIIALGTSTEPYMPQERELRLTRAVLEVILRHRFPVHVLTKSSLVIRDADLLAEIGDRAILPPDLEGRLESGAMVTVSLSTLDEDIARIFEPGAPPPSERLDLMLRLRSAGIFAGVAYIPVLPFISDSEDCVRRMIRAAKEHGAAYVFVGALTLFGECKRSFYAVLSSRFQELLPKYRRLFGPRGEPPKTYQAELDSVARRACAEEGVRYMLI